MDMFKEKRFESCRLCLVDIRDSNITLLDGIIKDMLEIILPELNLSICDMPAICKTCLETLKQSYNFKSSCLEVEDKVQDFVEPKSPSTIDLKQVIKKANNINSFSANHVVCRTCLGLGEANACIKLCSYEGDPLKNMVEKCLPEMGIELTKDPKICPICLEQLEEQFHFIMQCLDTEEKINYYCERKSIFKQIDLHSVYLFSMMDDNEDVDKQYEDMQTGNLENHCTDVKTDKHVNKNTIVQQSTQEITKNITDNDAFVDLTKDMFANVVKKAKVKKDPHKKNKIKPHSEENKSNINFFEELPPATEAVTFAVGKDGNGEDIITSETSQIKDENEDSDVSVTGDNKLLTTKFVETLHRNRKSKVEYKSDKNEDSGEESAESSSTKKRLVTRKCKLCDFKTKYTSRMKAHRTRNHSVKSDDLDQDNESQKKTPKPKSELDTEQQFKCRSCSFRTKDACEYKKHKQVHKKEKEQKCHICDMVFVRLDFLKKHVEKHTKVGSIPASVIIKKVSSQAHPPEKPIQKKCNSSTFRINGKFLKMFKCQVCPYQTRMRSNLVKHALIHKTTTEIKTNKCTICNFETIHKENFLGHMQSHSRDSANQVRKCFLCSFQPKTEEALRQHVNLVHKSGTG